MCQGTLVEKHYSKLHQLWKVEWKFKCGGQEHFDFNTAILSHYSMCPCCKREENLTMAFKTKCAMCQYSAWSVTR